jgi:hypothetical protein
MPETIEILETAGSKSRPAVRVASNGRFRSAHPRQGAPMRARQPRTPTVPLGFLGMIGLILLIESFTARNWLDFSDPVSLSWRQSAQLAQIQAKRCELLCLGDSLVKHALVPAVMEQELAAPAVNLAAARCPTPMTYFLLRRALDSGSRPRAIVFDVKPAVLMGGPEWNLRYWQEVVTLREAIELFPFSRKGRLLVLTLAGRLLPSLRGRLELRTSLLAALRGRRDPLHEINRVLWRNWSVNRGANVPAPRLRYAGEGTPEAADRLHARRFCVDRANAEAIERLLRLAAARKIPVFWLLPPVWKGLQSIRDQSGAEAAYENFVRSFQARHTREMTVLDARRAAYPAELFVDATHVNYPGAVVLSRAVARAIDQQLAHAGGAGDSRWIKLEPCPTIAAGDDPPLEDLDQSRSIIQGREPQR